MDYTLKTLARRIAFDDSEEAIKSAARRIEHWASVGLMRHAGLDIGAKAIGRGRVRRYPEEAVPWCLLWGAFANRGFGITTMAGATHVIQLKLLDNGQEAKWLRQAMRGELPSLFLLDESAGLRDPIAGKFKLARSPIELADDWSGGCFLNLTEIYDR